MERRRYLAAVLGGIAGGLAGCAGARERAAGAARSTPTGSVTTSAPITGADGNPADICGREPRPNWIPAIVDPAFGPNWDDVSGEPPSQAPERRGWELTDATAVVGIDRAGTARAYPLSLLNSFEIVNDSFDVPVIVTYCPLCASGLVAVRRVNGRETVFGNTGRTWRPPDAAGSAAVESGHVFGISDRDRPGRATPTVDPNLVLFDRATGSFWSQLLARAICGPLTGETLSLVPSTVAEWGRWRREHPETTVLLPPPRSTTWVGA